MPVKNSSAAIRRSPASPRTMMVASSASMQAGNSEAGSACARLPPSVPRLRIAGCATWALASGSNGASAALSGEIQETAVARQAADRKLGAVQSDSPELAEIADIDQQFRREQTQIHRRH